MTTEITIQKLRLKVPLSSSLRTAREGEALARAVADGIARNLSTRPVAARNGAIDNIRIALRPKQRSVAGMVNAIDSALRRKLSGARRSR